MSKFPGWRTMTSAERYNAKAAAIFAAARAQGHLTLSGKEVWVTEPPTWDAGPVKGWRDHTGGIKIIHDDGTTTYIMPGRHAKDLANTLDQCGTDKENIGVLLCDQLE